MSSATTPSRAAFLDSWRISDVSTFGTGGRGNISVSYNPGVTAPGGEDCGRYNIVGDPMLPSGQRTIDNWFNTAAYVPISATATETGNGCDPWQFRLPGWNHHDLTLFKDFKLKGNQTLQYRWEIYNLFNTVEYQTVNTVGDVQHQHRRADQLHVRGGDGGPQRAPDADGDQVHVLAS